MAVSNTKAGRIGGVEEARQLVALVATLTEPGDTLDAQTVASRMGVGPATAAKLLQIIRSSQTGDTSYLPLVDEGDDEVTLAEHRGANVSRGRRLRLTDAETRAVSDALERLGVASDDPLRRTIDDTLSSPGVDLAALRRTLAPGPSTQEAQALGLCAEALRDGLVLEFSYRKVHTTEVSRRHVAPSQTERRGGSWYLVGQDLDSAGERTFRVDHMSDVTLAKGKAHEGPDEKPGNAAGQVDSRMVGLTFADPSYLLLLDWHDLTVDSGEDDVATARIPWYGGDWLPRMVAACGGTCTCDDQEVMDRSRQIAREALANRGKQGVLP